MDKGDAFIFLSTVAHGAGYNTTNDVRKIYNIVFVRGTKRTEENMALCTPRSKVMKMSPKMLSLLGFKKPARNWLGMVENEDPAKDLAGVYEKMLS
jgi:ectoine hydroxylase-related dioxygenase (phytanoyl-CoA dioxygenase family)